MTIDNRPKARRCKDIWYSWYPGDYAAKTAHLTMVEDGAYRRLLDHYYQMGGKMVANATILLRVCRAFKSQEQAALKKILAEFFIERGGLYYHERADAELEKRAQLRQKRAEAGSIGGKKKVANATSLLQSCYTQSHIRTRTEVNTDTTLSSHPDTQKPILTSGVCVNERKPPKLTIPKTITSKIERGTRWTSGQAVPPEWVEAAAERRRARGLSTADLATEAEMFANYWAARPGAGGIKLDWKATWINWALKSHGVFTNGKGRNGTVIDDHPLGNFAAIADRLARARVEGREPFDA